MLKVGLIGCGFMGAMHTNCYRAIPGVEVTAFADVRPEKAKALSGDTGAKLYPTGMELIADADVDIIDICLPTYLHAEHALAAMEKVKYLFIEKPVALTAEEGEALLRKAAVTGCRVQVGQVIRFWDEYVELKKLLDSGNYGKVVNAVFHRISPRPDWAWQGWVLDHKRSGGAAQDLHVHDIDFVLSLFGAPEDFRTVKNRIGEKNSYVNTHMIYPDFVVDVEGTWDLPASFPFSATFRVVCEKAAFELKDGLRIYTDAGVSVVNIEKIQLEGGDNGGNISDLGGYYNELLYFTDRAKAGEPITRAALPDAVTSLNFVLGELAE